MIGVEIPARRPVVEEGMDAAILRTGTGAATSAKSRSEILIRAFTDALF